MNKNIASAFENKKAFIGFVTAGDPDLDTSRQILLEMAKNGCDLIEVGIPFSDPIAEGPVIQEANIRALTQGVTTDKVFDLVEEVSALLECAVPVWLRSVLPAGSRQRNLRRDRSGPAV